jgi:hypothetical protein
MLLINLGQKMMIGDRMSFSSASYFSNAEFSVQTGDLFPSPKSFADDLVVELGLRLEWRRILFSF